MTIIGNVLCVNMMRTDYLESDPSMGSYMLNNPKEDVDTAKALANAALPKSGGSMTGGISMGGNKVTGLADPSGDTDATHKKYVHDYVADYVSDNVPNMINDALGVIENGTY